MSDMENDLEKRLSFVEQKVKTQTQIERLLSLLAVAGAMITFGWGLVQFFHTRQTEFRKAFWEKQYELYSSVSDTAATIAIADDLESVKKQRAEFWNLYWGRLSMVENRDVHDAMVAFGKHLKELEGNPTFASHLRQLSYDLARACRRSLKDTWEPVTLDDIPETKAMSKDAYSKD